MRILAVRLESLDMQACRFEFLRIAGKLAGTRRQQRNADLRLAVRRIDGARLRRGIIAAGDALPFRRRIDGTGIGIRAEALM